jgi:hypothetical protein
MGLCSLCANAAHAQCDRCHHLVCWDHRRQRLQYRWQHRCTITSWYGIRDHWQSYALTGGEWALCPACEVVIAQEDARQLAISRCEQRWRAGCASIQLALFLGLMIFFMVYDAVHGMPH